MVMIMGINVGMITMITPTSSITIIIITTAMITKPIIIAETTAITKFFLWHSESVPGPPSTFCSGTHVAGLIAASCSASCYA